MTSARPQPTAVRSGVTLRQFTGDLVSGHRRLFWVCLGLTILGTFTESLGLLLLVPLVVAAGVVDGGSSSITAWVQSVLDVFGVPFTLGWMLVVYVVLIALRAGIGLARSICTARLRHHFVDALRVRLFEAVAKARWQFHLERRSSDISHVLTADVGRVSIGTFVVLEGLARAVSIGGFVLVALRLSVPTTLASICIMSVLLTLLWPTIKQSRRAGAAQTRFSRSNFGVQAEFLDALKLAKSHGNEARHIESYAEALSATRDSQLGFEWLSARSGALLQVGVATSVAVVTWLAVEQFDTPRAELLGLIAVIARLAPAASAVLSRLQAAANMLPAYDNAMQFMADAEAAAEPELAGVQASAAEGPIEVDSVSFAYGQGRDVLTGIDLTIAPGAVVAVVGPSGAGKTTLGDLILGLIEPSAGEIRLGGTPIDEIGLVAWRKRLAYVPQDSFLFHDSLRANIEWAAPDGLDDAELQRLVVAAALTEVIDALPDGLETVVGDRGHRLSGGERQRVAIARALARKPSLLVLDEATSALDSENEEIVQEAIDRLHGSVAMLVIAHRLSTVRRADEIIVLEYGRIVERGSWQELQALDGTFAAMLRHGQGSPNLQVPRP